MKSRLASCAAARGRPFRCAGAPAPRGSRPRSCRSSRPSLIWSRRARQRSRKPARSFVVGDDPRRAGRVSTSASTGSNSSPVVAVAQQLLVDGQSRDDRGAPAGDRLEQDLRAPARPRPRSRSRRRRAPSSSRQPRSPASAKVTRSRSVRPSRGSASGARSVQTVACQSAASSSLRRPRRNRRNAARSSTSANTISTRSPAAPRARSAGIEVRTAPARPRIAGEEAADEAARHVEGRHPRIEAPEEQLDEATCHLGREHPLGRRVEGADVERPRVAQRRRRGARGERLVDVQDVERDAASAAARSCA